MIAASPAAKSSRHSTSDRPNPAASDPSKLMPRAKKGAAPSQSQRAPQRVNEWVAAPAEPAQAEPKRTKTIAETASAHRLASMAWAALRERPSPWWISASPAAAKGTNMMENRPSSRFIGAPSARSYTHGSAARGQEPRRQIQPLQRKTAARERPASPGRRARSKIPREAARKQPASRSLLRLSSLDGMSSEASVYQQSLGNWKVSYMDWVCL